MLPEATDDIRVTSLELFFDLVFVFTITQLTSVLVAEPNATGVARAGLIFGNLWWMYGGYAWLTNNVPPKRTVVRLMILLGMAAFLVVALAIPRAFTSSGVVFGYAYLAVNLIHAGMFLLSTDGSALQAALRLGPTNAMTAVILVVAGYADGSGQWALWIVAFLLHWVTPYFTAVEGFDIRAAHFVERHGLILLIALGESIIAIGLGVGDEPLGAKSIATAALGLARAAAMWWFYFTTEEERAEAALAAGPRKNVTWTALWAFGYAFLPILFGIVVLAAGVKGAIAHIGDAAPAANAWFVALGAAGYLAGLAWFRWLLDLGPIAARVAAAAAAVPTAFIGMALSAEAQLAVLLVVVIAAIIADTRATPDE